MNEIYSIDEIRNRLNRVFSDAPIYKAILFGSYAKGNATVNSDVDIVIDSKGELLNMSFYGVLEDVTQSLGKNVDLFELSEIKKDSPIFCEIQNQGVLLYDRRG